MARAGDPGRPDVGATLRDPSETWDGETIQRKPSSTIDPSQIADAAGLSALTSLRVLRQEAQTSNGIAASHTIGEGGMSIVRLGTQLAMGREVALKTVRPGPMDEATLLRLVREAWVTGSLEHPNIVPIYDVRIDKDGRPLVVLKRIQGKSWSELLASPAEAAEVFGDADIFEHHLRVLVQVANAVHFAHTRGIIHRDLKPENVMIGSFGEVYVLDWGLAVTLEPDPSGRLPWLGDAKEMAGTPCYMAPEMIGHTSEHALSVQTDVYLLGAILYEILEGCPPNRGETIIAILSELATIDPPVTRAPSRDLAALCRRALAKKPADRLESALAFRLALEECLRHRGSVKLVERATSALVELRELCGALDIDTPEPTASRIRAAFGAARFGYRAALEAWPTNPEAERGLEEATSLVVDVELATGNPHTASTLLGELETPPPALQKRVARKLAEKVDADRRRIALEDDQDHEIGARTRAVVALILGGLWTVSPVFAWFVLYGKKAPTHQATMLGTAALLVVVLGLAVWGRESLGRTALNRGLISYVVFAMLAQLLLEVGAILLDVPELHAQVFKLLLWLAIVALGALGLDRRVAPIAGVITLGYVVAALRPEWVFFVSSAINLLMTILFGIIWWPRAKIPAAPSTRRGGLPPTD